jgi:hypothetical protein
MPSNDGQTWVGQQVTDPVRELVQVVPRVGGE